MITLINWPKQKMVRNIFNDDQIKSSGDLLIQIDLANTLERIARFGAAGFIKAKQLC